MGPSSDGTKTKRKRAYESREKTGWGGSQLSRDRNKKKEHMRAEKEEDEVGLPVKSGPKQNEGKHMRAEKKQGGVGPS